MEGEPTVIIVAYEAAAVAYAAWIGRKILLSRSHDAESTPTTSTLK